MLQEISSSILLVCGISSSFLILVDWLLSKAQKDQIRDIATNVWYWLSEQTPKSYLKFVATKPVYLAFSILVLAYFSIPTAAQIVLGFQNAQQFTISAILLIGSTIMLYRYGYRFHIWSIAGSKPFEVFRYLFGINTCISLFIGVFWYFGNVIILSQNATIKPIGVSFVIIYIVSFAALGPFMSLTLPSMIAMLIISILMIVFKFFEFVVVRIAESDKGPVLALSGLLTAVGVIIKFVSK